MSISVKFYKVDLRDFINPGPDDWQDLPKEGPVLVTTGCGCCERTLPVNEENLTLAIAETQALLEKLQELQEHVKKCKNNQS